MNELWNTWTCIFWPTVAHSRVLLGYAMMLFRANFHFSFSLRLRFIKMRYFVFLLNLSNVQPNLYEYSLKILRTADFCLNERWVMCKNIRDDLICMRFCGREHSASQPAPKTNSFYRSSVLTFAFAYFRESWLMARYLYETLIFRFWWSGKCGTLLCVWCLVVYPHRLIFGFRRALLYFCMSHILYLLFFFSSAFLYVFFSLFDWVKRGEILIHRVDDGWLLIGEEYEDAVEIL